MICLGITIKKKLNQFKSLLKTNDKVPHTVQDSIVVRNKTRKLTNDKILFFIDLVLGIILSITLFSLRGSFLFISLSLSFFMNSLRS